jgi:hypothetical protein
MSILAKLIIEKAVKHCESGKINPAILELCNATMVLAGFGIEKPPDDPKPLTLADLKRQVDVAFMNDSEPDENCPFHFSKTSDILALIGDFEIRRRK